MWLLTQCSKNTGLEFPEYNTENGNYTSQDVVRAAARNRQPQQMRTNQMQQRGGMGGPTQLPMNPQQQQQQQQQMHQQQMQPGMPGMPQQVIEHDENLSDKEVFPGSMHQQQMVSGIFKSCIFHLSATCFRFDIHNLTKLGYTYMTIFVS
jgi:hypothetical protein